MAIQIFVAGGTGMVGSAIIRKLQSQGYTNIVSNYHSRLPTDESIQWKQLDLTDQQAVAAFFAAQKPDMVFLAAAKVGGIMANNSYPGEFIYENLMIQTNVLHQAYLHGVKRLIFLGSSCIYPKHAPQPMKEEHLMTGPLEPTNSPYAVAKIAGVEMCEAYNRQYGTSYLPVMPTNLYGTHDNFDLETSHVLPALIRKFHLGKCLEQGDWPALRANLNQHPIQSVDGNASSESILQVLSQQGITFEGDASKQDNNELQHSSALSTDHRPLTTVTLWGSGTPKREFLHVDDLASACVYLMFQTSETQLTNIGVGEDLTIKELADLVRGIVGYEGQVQYDQDKPDGTPRKLLDVSRLHQMGWQAEISLEEGIRSAYNWYSQNSSR